MWAKCETWHNIQSYTLSMDSLKSSCHWKDRILKDINTSIFCKGPMKGTPVSCGQVKRWLANYTDTQFYSTPYWGRWYRDTNNNDTTNNFISNTKGDNSDTKLKPPAKEWQIQQWYSWLHVNHSVEFLKGFCKPGKTFSNSLEGRGSWYYHILTMFFIY